MKADAKLSFVAVALAAVLAAASAYAAGEDAPLANGIFLVARPELADPNFRETVVLVTGPQAGGGPLGVIINRPVAARLAELMPELGAVPERFEQVYGGGPVAQGSVVFLLRSGRHIDGALPVLADVWLSGDPALLRSIVNGEIEVEELRVYAGYSGWAPGQLQSEIRRGGWHVTPADAESIFAADASGLWPEFIRRLTSRRARLDSGACGASAAC